MLKINGGVRNNLTTYMLNEQLSLDSSANPNLDTKTQMAYGALSRDMVRLTWDTVNKPLVSKDRWVEFLDVLCQLKADFSSADEIRRFFYSMGVDTRTGDIYEMYLSMDNLACDYCVQVDLGKDEPFFVKLKAYVKDALTSSAPAYRPKHHWWEGR